MSSEERKRWQWEIVGRTADVLGVISVLIQIAYAAVALFTGNLRLSGTEYVALFSALTLVAIAWLLILVILKRRQKEIASSSSEQRASYTLTVYNWPRQRGCSVAIGNLIKISFFASVLLAVEFYATATTAAVGFNVGVVLPILGLFTTVILFTVIVFAEQRLSRRLLYMALSFIGSLIWIELTILGLSSGFWKEP